MRRPATATTPSPTARLAMTDDQLRRQITRTQQALRTAFARRAWVISTGDRLDALVAEADRRGLRL